MAKPSKPLWLVAAPLIFLLLWSGGFSIAKLGLKHAEFLSFLALRYATVLVILAPLFFVMRPTTDEIETRPRMSSSNVGGKRILASLHQLGCILINGSQIG